MGKADNFRLSSIRSDALVFAFPPGTPPYIQSCIAVLEPRTATMEMEMGKMKVRNMHFMRKNILGVSGETSGELTDVSWTHMPLGHCG